MNVVDLVRPAESETSAEGTTAEKQVMSAFEHVAPAATCAVSEGWEKRFLPHDRRDAARQAVALWSYLPVATAPMPALQGEFKNVAYPYWLRIALAEPLASTTPASFEIRVVEPVLHASPFNELAHYYVKLPAPAQPESRAYRTFVELADWLGMTQEETANVLGIGRTTPLAWRRGTEPQPARARRLYQTHALLSTLVRRLGRDEVRRWLVAGDPSPLALIAQGDVTGADDLADELIFGTAPSRERLGAWVEEPVDTEPSAGEPKHGPPRRVRRRPPRRRTP